METPQGRTQMLIWVICGLFLHLSSLESHKTLEQKFIFQIALVIPTVSTSAFHSTNLFFISRHHTPTDSVAPPSAYKPTHNPQFLQSLWRRAKARNFSFFTHYDGHFTFSTQLLPLNYLLYSPTDQDHSFFRNLPSLFIFQFITNNRFRGCVVVSHR